MFRKFVIISLPIFIPSKKYFHEVYIIKECKSMINRIETNNSQTAFGAKVNLDARCRKYYKECNTFKKVVDTMRNEMKAAEVDLKSDFGAHWSGTRTIYALSESYKGGFNEIVLGEIDTRPIKTVSGVVGELGTKGPNMSFYPKEWYISEAIRNNDEKRLAQELDARLYWAKGQD